MKLNIELKDLELNEAGVVLAALNALKNSNVPVSVQTTEEPTSEVEPLPPADEKDADGLVWDGRIHSSNHKKTADNRWQRRRNVPDEMFESIKNELLARDHVQSAPVAETVIPPMPVEPATEPVNPTIPATPVEPVQPATPVEPVVPVAPVTAAEPEVDTNALYIEMFAKLQAGFKAKKIDANYIQNTLATLNTMFGKGWTGLAEIKEDANALRVVIDQLTAEGL